MNIEQLRIVNKIKLDRKNLVSQSVFLELVKLPVDEKMKQIMLDEFEKFETETETGGKKLPDFEIIRMFLHKVLKEQLATGSLMKKYSNNLI